MIGKFSDTFSKGWKGFGVLGDELLQGLPGVPGMGGGKDGRGTRVF
jgi:hypothetical protein